MSYSECPTCGAPCKVVERHDWRCGLMGGTMQFLTGLLWAFALGVYLIVYRLASPDTIDRLYSEGLFRQLGAHVIPYTEQLPFSLSLVLTGLLVLGGPLLWLIQIVRFIARGDGFLAGLVWGPVRLFFLAPMLFVWFAVFWGAGYQRPPVEKRMALDDAKPTTEEVQQIQERLLPIILRDKPATPDQRDVPRAVHAIAQSMAKFIEEDEGRAVRVPQRVKATPKGLLLANSTSGICSPFTLEANVDGAIPDTGFVYVAAHELAHTAGLNRENEATLYGQIAGLRADDAYARYCIALDAYMDLTRDLDKDQRKAALDKLPQECVEEIKHIHEVSSSYNVKWFSERSWKVYNKYLQSQGIKEGVKNYSASTKLFVYANRKGLLKLS